MKEPQVMHGSNEPFTRPQHKPHHGHNGSPRSARRPGNACAVPHTELQHAKASDQAGSNSGCLICCGSSSGGSSGTGNSDAASGSGHTPTGHTPDAVGARAGGEAEVGGLCTRPEVEALTGTPPCEAPAVSGHLQHADDPLPCRDHPDATCAPVPAARQPLPSCPQQQQQQQQAWKQAKNWASVFEAPTPLLVPSRLHYKLTSPDRGRKTPSEAKQAAEEKQARAERLRTALTGERLARLARAKETWEQKHVAAKGKDGPAAAAETRLGDRHQRSELLRREHLKRIRRKAGDETRKVAEVSFINSLKEADRKQVLQQRLEDGEQRRQDAIACILARQQEAQAAISQAQERRKLAEAERQAALVMKLQRREAVQAKLEEERRNSALAREQQNEHARSLVEQAAAARRQEAAAVATRLNARLQEAAARRMRHLALIREKAAVGKEYDRRDSFSSGAGPRSPLHAPPDGCGPATAPSRSPLPLPRPPSLTPAPALEHGPPPRAATPAAAATAAERSCSPYLPRRPSCASPTVDQFRCLMKGAACSQSVKQAGVTIPSSLAHRIKGSRRRAAKLARRLQEARCVWTEPREADEATGLPEARATASDWTEPTSSLRQAMARDPAPPQPSPHACVPDRGALAAAGGTGAAAAASTAAAAYLSIPEHHPPLLALMDSVTGGLRRLGRSVGCHVARRCGVVDLLTLAAAAAPAGGSRAPPPPGVAHVQARACEVLSQLLKLPCNRDYMLCSDWPPLLVRAAVRAMDAANNDGGADAAGGAGAGDEAAHMGPLLQVLRLLTAPHESTRPALAAAREHLVGYCVAAGVVHRISEVLALFDRPQLATAPVPPHVVHCLQLLHALTSAPAPPPCAAPVRGGGGAGAADAATTNTAGTSARAAGGGCKETAAAVATAQRVGPAEGAWRGGHAGGPAPCPPTAAPCAHGGEEVAPRGAAGEDRGRPAAAPRSRDGGERPGAAAAAQTAPAPPLQRWLLRDNRWSSVGVNTAGIVLALQETSMGGLLSLLTAVLLHAAPSCLPAEAQPHLLPSNFVAAALLVLRTLNNAARLDLLAAQQLLGGPHHRLELFHLISFLISYASNAWPQGGGDAASGGGGGGGGGCSGDAAPRRASPGGPPGGGGRQHHHHHSRRRSSSCAGTPDSSTSSGCSADGNGRRGGGQGGAAPAAGGEAAGAAALLDELLLLLGYVCVGCPVNASMLSWGKPPGIMQRLLEMPAECLARPVVLPTLLCCVHGHPRACDVLERSVPLERLLRYAERHMAFVGAGQQRGGGRGGGGGERGGGDGDGDAGQRRADVSGTPGGAEAAATAAQCECCPVPEMGLAQRFPLELLPQARAFLLERLGGDDGGGGGESEG